MSRSSQKQSGFAVLEMLLVLVVLAVVAAVCWFVYKSSTDTISTLDEANKSAAVQAGGKSKAATPQYLTVKEWGVKLPLTPAIADAEYKLNSGYVYLSLRSLAGKECAVTNEAGSGIGAITRFTAGEKDPTSGTLLTTLFPDAPKVGKYSFFFESAKTDCGGDKAIMEKVSNAVTAFNAQTAKIVSATE